MNHHSKYSVRKDFQSEAERDRERERERRTSGRTLAQILLLPSASAGDATSPPSVGELSTRVALTRMGGLTRTLDDGFSGARRRRVYWVFKSRANLRDLREQ